MEILDFWRGIPTNYDKLDQAAFLLREYISRGTMISLGRQANKRYWQLRFAKLQFTDLPSIINTVAKPTPHFIEPQLKYFLVNRSFAGRLDERHKGFNQILKTIWDMPFESFFVEQSNFTIFIHVIKVGESTGSLHQTAQLVLGTDSPTIAEQLSRRLGCQVSSSSGKIEVTTEELQFFFRPPVANDDFAPIWTDRPPDFLQYICQHPELLLHHTLVCGKPGSGKSHTVKYIVENVAAGFDSILILDKKGEFSALSKNSGLEYIEASKLGGLKSLNCNPFIPANNVRLQNHIEDLALNLTVSLFGGAGSLAAGFMRLFLEHYYEALLYEQRLALGFNGTNNNFGLFAMNLTGWDIKDKLGKAGIYIFKNANTGFLEYWEKNKDRFAEKTFGTLRSQGSIEVVSMINTRMQAIRNSLFNAFDYGSSGYSIEKLKGRKIVLSLQGLSITETRFLIALICTQIFTMTMASDETSLPRWLLVLEEAQNLASKSQTGSGEVISGEKILGDLFSMALAETRSKGLAIISVTQMPSLLVDGVIANTGIKIVHNLVGRDQEAIGHTLGMREKTDFTTLGIGTCWIKIDENLPFLYQVSSS